jgi:hypothetical protein
MTWQDQVVKNLADWLDRTPETNANAWPTRKLKNSNRKRPLLASDGGGGDGRGASRDFTLAVSRPEQRSGFEGRLKQS